MAKITKTPVKKTVKTSKLPKGVGWSPEAMNYIQQQIDGTRAEIKEAARKQGMIQGLALAIALMYKGEDQVRIWKSAGLTIGECITNEVAEYDMDEIVKHWKELDGIAGGQY